MTFRELIGQDWLIIDKNKNAIYFHATIPYMKSTLTALNSAYTDDEDVINKYTGIMEDHGTKMVKLVDNQYYFRVTPHNFDLFLADNSEELIVEALDLVNFDVPVLFITAPQ